MGKGIFHASKIPITDGRDLNAMSNALVKQQEDFVKNAASKLIPNSGNATQHTNGAANPSKPSSNGETAGANVPVPDGAPYTDGTNQQNANQSHNILQRAVSDVEGVNKQALNSAHNVAHGIVGSIPGGQQASQFTHGLAQNFIPGSIGAANGGGN